MVSSKQAFLLVCSIAWLVACLVIWFPMRDVITSLKSVDLSHIVIGGHQSSSSSSSPSPSPPLSSPDLFPSSLSSPSSCDCSYASTSSTASTTSTSTIPTPTTVALLPAQIVLFGDSITEKSSFDLVAPLADRYIRRFDVVNRGFSGYTAPQGLTVLPHWFPATPPYPDSYMPQVRLMTIFFGANDATNPGLQAHVPLEMYQDALRQIANHEGVKLHKTKLIFITPPPVDEHQLSYGNFTRTAQHTAKYAEACCQTAASLELPCLDLWSLMMAKAGWHGRNYSDENLIGSSTAERSLVLDQLLDDGLHLTPMGYKMLFDELLALIDKVYLSENLRGPVFPLDWDNIEPDQEWWKGRPVENV